MSSSSDPSAPAGGARRRSFIDTLRSVMGPSDMTRRRASSSASTSSLSDDLAAAHAGGQPRQLTTAAVPTAPQPYRDATDVGSQFLEDRTPGRQAGSGMWRTVTTGGWGGAHQYQQHPQPYHQYGGSTVGSPPEDDPYSGGLHIHNNHSSSYHHHNDHYHHGGAVVGGVPVGLGWRGMARRDRQRSGSGGIGMLAAQAETTEWDEIVGAARRSGRLPRGEGGGGAGIGAQQQQQRQEGTDKYFTYVNL